MVPVSGQYFENVTPVTGKVFCEIARSNSADIELALLRRRDGMSDPALAWLAELVAAPLTQSGGEAMS